MAGMGLQDILDGSEAPAPEAPPEGAEPHPDTRPMAETKRPEPLDRPRRADGTFKSKEEIDAEKAEAPAPAAAAPEAPKPAEAPAAAPAAAPAQNGQQGAPMDPQVRAFLAAAQEERRKRQELERQIAELRQKVAPEQAQAQPKTFWDDPEGWIRQQQESQRRAAQQDRLSVAEMIAKSKYSDYDEKIQHFTQMVQSTPGLAQAWLAAPDPAEYAYRSAKAQMELQQAGSLDAWKAQREKELRVAIEAEMRQKAEALAAEKAKLPGSLSDVKGGATQRTKAEFTGPTPLDDILARPKKK